MGKSLKVPNLYHRAADASLKLLSQQAPNGFSEQVQKMIELIDSTTKQNMKSVASKTMSMVRSMTGEDLSQVPVEYLDVIEGFAKMAIKQKPKKTVSPVKTDPVSPDPELILGKDPIDINIQTQNDGILTLPGVKIDATKMTDSGVETQEVTIVKIQTEKTLASHGEEMLVCADWVRFCTWFDPGPSACHSLMDHGKYHPKAPLCRFYISGKCKKGDKCPAIHMMKTVSAEEEDKPKFLTLSEFQEQKRTQQCCHTVSAPKQYVYKSVVQKSVENRCTQICLNWAIANLQGKENPNAACPHGRKCTFAHGPEEIVYEHKAAETKFDKICLEEDKGEYSGIFQYAYESLKEMFSHPLAPKIMQYSHRQFRYKLTRAELENINITLFPKMMRSWFNIACFTHSKGMKRQKLADFLGVPFEEVPSFHFDKWEVLMWAIGRRCLPLCGGYMRMMEAAGDGMFDKSLQYNSRDFCRKYRYCAHGIHPGEYYVDEANGISYAINCASLVGDTEDGDAKFEQDLAEIKKNLETAKTKYETLRNEFHSVQNARKDGDWCKVGRIKEVSEELSKAKRDIKYYTSQKVKMIKYFDPVKYGFSKLHEPTDKSVAIKQTFSLPVIKPEVSTAMVSYDPNRALASTLAKDPSSCGVSFATAAAKVKKALPVPPKPVAGQKSGQKSVQKSEPEPEPEPEPAPVPEKVKVVDEDGFEMVETAPRRLFRKKKAKKTTELDIEAINAMFTSSAKHSAVPKEELPEKSEFSSDSEVEDPETDKANPFLTLATPHDGVSESESTIESEHDECAKPGSKIPFWHTVSSESDEEELIHATRARVTDVQSKLFESDSEEEDTEGLSKPREIFFDSYEKYLVVAFKGHILSISGFTEAVNTKIKPHIGMPAKIDENKISISLKKGLTQQKFTTIMMNLYVVFERYMLINSSDEIVNNTLFEHPRFRTTHTYSIAKKPKEIKLDTRLTGKDKEIYSLYMFVTSGKKAMTRIGPLTKPQANHLKCDILDAKVGIKESNVTVSTNGNSFEIVINRNVRKNQKAVFESINRILKISGEKIKT